MFDGNKLRVATAIKLLKAIDLYLVAILKEAKLLSCSLNTKETSLSLFLAHFSNPRKRGSGLVDVHPA